MTQFKIANTNELADNQGKLVSIEGRDIALFKHDGKFFAIDNECPHRGGPLSEGPVADGMVTCPFHAWQFRLADGKHSFSDVSVASYKVEIKGEEVFIEL
ncbi:MAG TPA: Rieske 2Fe-2S domain-containing protein [Candidatus Norongarragalinales archaeon]|jgi:NAD(P)H-dependent nitrite reductase small subunit|nr:Rieske 2Fe-2S domain-containing protein [Candidatus Norongarragalinales archaeon]